VRTGAALLLGEVHPKLANLGLLGSVGQPAVAAVLVFAGDLAVTAASAFLQVDVENLCHDAYSPLYLFDNPGVVVDADGGIVIAREGIRIILLPLVHLGLLELCRLDKVTRYGEAATVSSSAANLSAWLTQTNDDLSS